MGLIKFGFICYWVRFYGCVFQSGIHPTLAGIATAFVIPLRSNKKTDYSPLKTLESNLHLWVAFGVLPIFAFANAGVSFAGMTWEHLLNRLSLGIALGCLWQANWGFGV